MIRFADKTTRPQVQEMWKTVFGDPDDYIDVYFRHKYRDENTLVYIEDGKVVSSLQMLPYQFTFCGTEIPILYLAGVSTLPEYRRRGYTAQLLTKSFEEAAKRDVPLMLLVPQEEWLLNFYDQYGFAQTFDAGVEELPSLKLLVDKYSCELSAAFREFDTYFRQSEMTVQKSFDDFRTIVEEAFLYDFPRVRSLVGMSRVIDAERLLSLFALHYKEKSFSIFVQDELVERNNALFTVAGVKVKREHFLNNNHPNGGEVITADIRELVQLLLGCHTSKKGEPFKTLFPEKQPQIHFMLE